MDCRRRALWIMLLCCWLPPVAVAQTLPFGISLPPSLNFATSPAPVGSGARAQGKAVAFIAVADDATAASHNPAGLVQLQEPEASVVGSYFVRLERQDVTQPGIRVEDQTFDSADLNYLSGVYPFRLLGRNVVVSLNFQRLFDLKGATTRPHPLRPSMACNSAVAAGWRPVYHFPGRGGADHAHLFCWYRLQYLARSVRQRLDARRYRAWPGLRRQWPARCTISLQWAHHRGF